MSIENDEEKLEPGLEADQEPISDPSQQEIEDDGMGKETWDVGKLSDESDPQVLGIKEPKEEPSAAPQKEVSLAATSEQLLAVNYEQEFNKLKQAQEAFFSHPQVQAALKSVLNPTPGQPAPTEEQKDLVDFAFQIGENEWENMDAVQYANAMYKQMTPVIQKMIERKIQEQLGSFQQQLGPTLSQMDTFIKKNVIEARSVAVESFKNRHESENSDIAKYVTEGTEEHKAMVEIARKFPTATLDEVYNYVVANNPVLRQRAVDAKVKAKAQQATPVRGQGQAQKKAPAQITSVRDAAQQAWELLANN